MKKNIYYIKTYGCSANVADSSFLAGMLNSLGFKELAYSGENSSEFSFLKENLTDIDLLVINTCSVRQKSEDKVYGLGKIISQSKKKNNKPFVVLAGCMVGSTTGERKRYKFSELKSRTSWVDLYLGPEQIFSLPDMLNDKGVLSEWAVRKYNPAEIEPVRQWGEHAFVNISYGCDNFCTYCVVPYARGKEVHRSKEDIFSDIRLHVDRGVKKITLCGQNVNSWGLSREEKMKIRSGSRQKIPFATLLREIHEEIEKIEKIDFISSNPFDFTQDLIDVISLPKISDYIHIAVQSGNNDILKKMNRRHTAEDFMRLVEKIRNIKPGIKIGTDIIVGFPGETRDQFMDSARLVKKVGFAMIFISMYSPRKGTSADIAFKDDISLEEKKWRHSYLTGVWKTSLMEIPEV